MKKLAVLFTAVVLMAALAVTASAGIYYSDSFDGTELNPARWIVEGNKFFIDDSTGTVAAYSDGVVCQMEYRYDCTPTPGVFGECACSVRVQFRDYDREENHSAMLWWRDNFCHISEADGGCEYYNDFVGNVYTIGVNPDDNTAFLNRETYDEPLAVANLADYGINIEVGEKASTWFTLGWRITKGHMSGYVNNKKVIDVDIPDLIITASDNPMFTEKGLSGSPILLWNNGMYIAYDDFVVATPDTDLFEEGNVNPTPTQPTEPITSIASSVSEVVVTVTDENGEVVTGENGEAVTEVSEVIVTEVVTVAPADTQSGNGNGGNSTTTGDAALIVLAVMVVSLGAALAVKKVTVK